jgi:hypothetical protein
MKNNFFKTPYNKRGFKILNPLLLYGKMKDFVMMQ